MKRAIQSPIRRILHAQLSIVTLAMLGVMSIAPFSLATEKADPIPTEKAAEAAEKAGEAVQPGSDEPFWVPVARLSTEAPQRIQIQNKTGIPLEYLLTTHTNFRTLAAGKSVTLSNFPTPIFLNINAQESNYLVAYKVNVNTKANTLIVTVTLTAGADNRTLNLDETGAVYLY